jgi:hypothetical protein
MPLPETARGRLPVRVTRKGRHAAPQKADRLRLAACAVLAALLAGLVALAVAMLASGH